MSQNPKIAHFLIPNNIGSIYPFFFIVFAMISLPATPKLNANKIPILLIASSIMITSSASSFAFLSFIGFS